MKSSFINRMIELLSMFDEPIGTLPEGIILGLIDATSKFIDDISCEPYSPNSIELIYSCHKIGFSLKKVKKGKMSVECLYRIELLLLKFVSLLLNFIECIIGSQKEAKEILFKILKELYEFKSSCLEYYALLHNNYLTEKIQVSTKFFRRIIAAPSNSFESLKAQLLTAKNSYRCENYEESIKIYSQCLTNDAITDKEMIHLCIAIAYLHWSSSRSKSDDQSKSDLLKANLNFDKYYSGRELNFPEEANYNYGRYQHYMGNLIKAKDYYEKVIQIHSMKKSNTLKLVDNYSSLAGYNLSMIYYNWGAESMAQNILFAYSQ